MAAKPGSFRRTLSEKRERERLLSREDYSGLSGFGYPQDHRDRGGVSGLCSCRAAHKKLVELWGYLRSVAVNAWAMGRSDPRKIVFSAKMGLALILISLLMFLKEPIEEVSRYAVWAILTVVVVFEFSIGATFSKGFNRALGTLSAGGLALGMAKMSELAGEWEELVVVISIFVTGSCMTYAKLYPTMKPYEYGFRVFLITYCFIMVSGYQTGEFIHTAATRFLLIAMGAGVSLAVNICIYPIWAGEDLHNLVAKNFLGVASSLEGCVDGFLNCIEYKRVPSKILTFQASDDMLYTGYRSAMESTSQEDALVGFAVWEPPHGPYKTFKYPWRNYVKVSGTLRHCASMVMALHGCILSEIQAPPDKRQVFHMELRRVGTAGARVLRELGNKIKRMEKLEPEDILCDVHEAAEALQKKVDRKSYLFVNSENWEIGERKEMEVVQGSLNIYNGSNKLPEHKSLSEAKLDLRSISLPGIWNGQTCDEEAKYVSPPAGVILDENLKKQSSPQCQKPNANPEAKEESRAYESASALSMVTFTSLLIEFVARLENVVDAFQELSEKANFKERVDLLTVREEEEEEVGWWTRFRSYVKSRNRNDSFLA